MTVAQLMELLEQVAPLRLAESWDNVGLILGDPAAPASKVMTCLTLSPDVADEAISEKTDVVISHHPILFRSAKTIRADQPGGDIVWKLARAGVAVISHHTAWDGASGGANDYIANKLGLIDLEPISPAPGRECVKFIVFVADDNLEAVRSAAFHAGAGQIGNYRECSFSTPGTGTFYGLKGTQPTVGQVGIRESASEHRLEIVAFKHLQNQVLSAIKQAHSYEEPAIDVYPLAAVAIKSETGVGRVGKLTAALTTRELARLASVGLQSSATQFGLPMPPFSEKPILKVAIACGAGDDLIDLAIRSGSDALVTGELRFHSLLKARDAGLATVMVGHYASERLSMDSLAELLNKKCPDLNVWASHKESAPAMNL